MFQKRPAAAAVAVEPDEDDQPVAVGVRKPSVRPGARAAAVIAAKAKAKAKKPPTRVASDWQKIGNNMLASKGGPPAGIPAKGGSGRWSSQGR
jgi:hypothetical protein